MKIIYTFDDSIITQSFMQKVADFEGFCSKPYRCPSGFLTIGFGHRTSYKVDEITLEDASELLYVDLRAAYTDLFLKIAFLDFDTLPLCLKQALIDFVFNCGIGRFLSSSMYRILQTWPDSSDEERLSLMKKISDSLQLYVYSKGKFLKGLLKRRIWEASLIDDYLLQR